MTLFGKRVFASFIKLRFLRCGDHSEFGVDPKSNGRCPYKRKAEGDLRHRDKGRVLMKTEAEIGVRLPQKKQHLELSEAGRNLP